VTPNSNNQIQISISEEMEIKSNNIKIKISNIYSNSKELFIMLKGWYSIDDLKFNGHVLKACVFEDSNSIFLLKDTKFEENFFYGQMEKLELNEKGYSSTYINLEAGNIKDFKMYSSTVGVSIDDRFGRFISDAFKTINRFGNLEFGSDHTTITYLDESSCIMSNTGDNQYTIDKGVNFIYDPVPDYLKTTYYKTIVRSGGKGKDGFFYEIGKYFSGPISSYTTKNFVRKSDGYNNWKIIDTTTTANGFMHYPKFYDIDLILTKTIDNRMAKSSDLAKSWQIIKDNVSSFYIRNRTTWYIVSGDKVYFTVDSGINWNLELELPTGSKVNDISFSESKIILSGNNDLLYIKHE
jgi:hypothetical protein